MQSITTPLRAVVMLLALAIGWKAWQAYGPSNEQLRSIASRAVEIAQEALRGDTPPRKLVADPRLSPPAFAATPSLPNKNLSPGVAPTAAELLPTDDLVEPARFDVPTATQIAGEIRPLPEVDLPLNESLASQPASEHDEKLQSIIARLEADGVRETLLEPWGSGSDLYRFSCRVPWGQASNFTRHFESVAAEPIAAVMAVAQKVDDWRVAQAGAETIR